jgi:hypothetical protein
MVIFICLFWMNSNSIKIKQNVAVQATHAKNKKKIKNQQERKTKRTIQTTPTRHLTISKFMSPRGIHFHKTWTVTLICKL